MQQYFSDHSYNYQAAMKITAVPQVFDYLLKVAKVIFISQMCLKTSVQIAPPCTTLCSKLFARVMLLYDAYYVGYAWCAIFAMIHLVVLFDLSQNVLQRGCAASSTFSYQ